MRGTRSSGMSGRDMYSHHNWPYANHSKILLDVPYSSVDEISGPDPRLFSIERSGIQSR